MLVTYKQHVVQFGDNVPEHQSYLIFLIRYSLSHRIGLFVYLVLY